MLDDDTFLTAVYTVIDDLYRTHFAAARAKLPGARPQVSDSEVLTLLLAGHWHGWTERALLRHAEVYWRHLFPRLLSQSEFNRRSRNLYGVLVQLVLRLAQLLGAADAAYAVLDGVGVKVLRRVRGRQHRLFGDEVDIGRGGSDRDWIYGLKLLLAVIPRGPITGFIVGPASTEERWLLEALGCWRQDPTAAPWTPADLPKSHRRGGSYRGPNGPLWPRDGAGQPAGVVSVADEGFTSAVRRVHWAADYGLVLLLPADYQGETAAVCRHEHAACRQVVETVNDHLEEQFHLHFPGAKTFWGLRTRLAATLVAFNLGLWLNRHFGRPAFAFATLVA